MKIRAMTAAVLTAACFLLTGCAQTDRNTDRMCDAAVFLEIEKTTLACLAENDGKPEDIWSLDYDEDENMFTSATEIVRISRNGHILHGSCENPPPVIGEERTSLNESFGASGGSIEYGAERMVIELDAGAYHGMKNRNRSSAMTIPYGRLREPERYRMNRVAACLNAANMSLIHRLDK